MIITEEFKNKKFIKKLTPNKVRLVVSFFQFILTEDNTGVVLYCKEGEYSPFQYFENLPSIKLKPKTYQNLIDIFDNSYAFNKKIIKKAKTQFYDSFETACEVEIVKELFELSLENNDSILTKHIVCVVKNVDNIERSLNREDYTCKVVELTEINEIKMNEIIKNLLK